MLERRLSGPQRLSIIRLFLAPFRARRSRNARRSIGLDSRLSGALEGTTCLEAGVSLGLVILIGVRFVGKLTISGPLSIFYRQRD